MFQFILFARGNYKMKKIIAGGILSFAFAIFVFAGDAAVFSGKGFSEDGNYYIFGQYGKVDKTFQNYAELYAVDIKKNDYVSGGVFKTLPSKETANETAEETFNKLLNKTSYFTKKYNATPASADRILYIREEESKNPTDEIVFKDFTKSIGNERAVYRVHLIPTYKGSGENTKSSFFIMLEKEDGNGKIVASQKIGTPSLFRSGVVGYKIERIECDKSGRNLVFIIEKKVQDKTGINIRYMIEAASLNDDFFVSVPENAITTSSETTSPKPVTNNDEKLPPVISEADAK